MTDTGWTELKRHTRETEVALRLKLGGSGQTDLQLAPYFLRHMLETFALYAGCDLELKATGEDEHHLIEDVGITLGRAVRQALPDMKIERFAHAIVPMDDALVLAALDLVDRPYASVDLPDPLYAHMLRSMTLEGKFTLHLRPLAGEDVHHVVEAGFKALGRALRAAVQPVGGVSSAKGEVSWA